MKMVKVGIPALVGIILLAFFLMGQSSGASVDCTEYDGFLWQCTVSNNSSSWLGYFQLELGAFPHGTESPPGWSIQHVDDRSILWIAEPGTMIPPGSYVSGFRIYHYSFNGSTSMRYAVVGHDPDIVASGHTVVPQP
jgi:hypothetical protein